MEMEVFAEIRKKRQERIASGILRRSFEDEKYWSELARKWFIRLPAWDIEVTPDKMRRWLRKFRVTEQAYLEITGYLAIEDFQRLNSDWPLRAWLGLLLEYVTEREEGKKILRAYSRD